MQEDLSVDDNKPITEKNLHGMAGWRGGVFLSSNTLSLVRRLDRERSNLFRDTQTAYCSCHFSNNGTIVLAASLNYAKSQSRMRSNWTFLRVQLKRQGTDHFIIIVAGARTRKAFSRLSTVPTRVKSVIGFRGFSCLHRRSILLITAEKRTTIEPRYPAPLL